MIRTVKSEELRPGDVVNLAGTVGWATITDISPYSGPLEDLGARATARVAYRNGFGMTLIRGEEWDVQ